MLKKIVKRRGIIWGGSVLVAILCWLCFSFFLSDEKNLNRGSGTDFAMVQACLAEKKNVRAVILGDSIAKGYFSDNSVEIIPYGNLVMEQLGSKTNFVYSLDNFARNGLDSNKMNMVILTDDKVRSSLEMSDVIFITVGSNDLLNECKNAVQEILDTDVKFKGVGDALDVLGEAVSDNPLLILKIIEAIQEWDYRSFEEQWTEMMDTISDLKKEEAWIVVTNIYNPVEHLELPFTMNLVVENIIQNMNEIIGSYAEEYNYQVADLFHSDVYAHVQEDGLHPDQNGQQIIADTILLKNN